MTGLWVVFFIGTAHRW